MMVYIFSLLFMIPLIFFMESYWSICFLMFLLSFMYSLKMSFITSYCNLSHMFAVDLLSYMLILLSFWICSLMILASENLFKNNFYWKLFLTMIVFLMLCLYLTFSSLNLFVFYFFFEVSLIPTLFLIVGWGNQPERLMAGIYLLFYTLLVSLPMMVGLFYLYKIFYTMDFYFFFSVNNVFLYFVMNFIFFVKIPMYFLHLWLPKAHVEASISGSMILAGVMLKLGGYGLMRVLKLFLEIGVKINFLFILISLIGGLVISLICLRQSDMKMLIAYSSVSHMGLVLSGILTLNLWGFWGGLILMLAHGLCSSGLFCLANICYERTSTRSIFLNKGMLNLMPNLSLWWFLLCSCNMASPLSLNLMGEILLINSIIVYNPLFSFCLGFLAFFSAAYSLYLYSYTQHGKISSLLYSFSQINLREYLLLMLHWIPLNVLFLKLELVSFWL